MSITARLLTAYHMLGRELRRGRKRRFPDHARLARLERERLLLKDRIARHAPPTEATLALARRVLSRARRELA